ncbi:hypothetical protein ACLOJK_039389 [Asimina triloba]
MVNRRRKQNEAEVGIGSCLLLYTERPYVSVSHRPGEEPVRIFGIDGSQEKCKGGEDYKKTPQAAVGSHLRGRQIAAEKRREEREKGRIRRSNSHEREEYRRALFSRFLSASSVMQLDIHSQLYELSVVLKKGAGAAGYLSRTRAATCN